MFRSTFPVIISFMLLAGSAAAQLQTDTLQIPGFAGWGYGTNNGNTYQLDTEDGSYVWQENVFGAGFDYGPEFDSLDSHKDAGIAVSYWFSPNLVIKTGYHRVEGNRFASPDWDNFWQIVYGINHQTDLFQIGAQFSF